MSQPTVVLSKIERLFPKQANVKAPPSQEQDGISLTK